MVKILSQGGRSLADMYDIEGSIAGIEQLESREVTLVHEMGATLFSERMRNTFRRSTVLASQNLAFIIPITNFPPGISRILGVQVLADDATRVDRCQVSINDPVSSGGQDVPIWASKSVTLGVGVEFQTQNIANAGVTTTTDLLVPEVGTVQLPTFVLGDDQGVGFNMRNVTLRGFTEGFGAGTVLVTLLLHFAFTFTSGVSAYGANVPSW